MKAIQVAICLETSGYSIIASMNFAVAVVRACIPLYIAIYACGTVHVKIVLNSLACIFIFRSFSLQ